MAIYCRNSQLGGRRRFQPVTVPEPSVDETYQILLGLRERYEAHHKLRYTDESLMSAAKYASQYISDRFLPDKVRHALRSELPGCQLPVTGLLRSAAVEANSCRLSAHSIGSMLCSSLVYISRAFCGLDPLKHCEPGVRGSEHS